MSRRLACVVLCTSLVASWVATSAAADATCVYPSSYPGDSAPKDKIAAWMAGGAQAAGIPGELPVMAALAETGLTNAPAGDSDYAGYFQMRKSIWEASYPNFENDPAQQLKWFTDQAVKVRQAKIDAGDTTYGGDPSRYGEWAADIEMPPEQQRGQYQPYLDQSRSLIASGCASEPAPGGTPTGTPPPDNAPGGGGGATDVTAPGLTLGGARTQDVARTGQVFVVVTASEDGTATVTVTITIGKASRTYRLSAPPRPVAQGTPVTVRLRLGRKLRGAVRSALRRGIAPKVRATVVLVDGAGNRSSATRALRLPRRSVK